MLSPKTAETADPWTRQDRNQEKLPCYPLRQHTYWSLALKEHENAARQTHSLLLHKVRAEDFEKRQGEEGWSRSMGVAEGFNSTMIP
jgi:hypothetical protein